MNEFLATTIDKFTFLVDPGCFYSADGIWVRFEDNIARLGLSDFLQQRSGDIAFVEVKPVGTILTHGDDFASIETVKANVDLVSPLSGTVVNVNPLLITEPEVINQEPYGAGWLCEVAISDGGDDRQRLLSAGAYFETMKRQAEEAQ